MGIIIYPNPDRPLSLNHLSLVFPVGVFPVGGTCRLEEVELGHGRIPVETLRHGSNHEIYVLVGGRSFFLERNQGTVREI